jgi:predicted nucleic acid-binding Zn ribbon protein
VPDESDWQRRARLAAEALADAKADARAKGTRMPRRPAGAAGQPAGPGPDDEEQTGLPGRPAARQPRRGGRVRRDDPQPLSSALDGLLAEQGWRLAVKVGSVFGRWDQLVGAEVAAHTRPERFADGELLVAADSAAWATQVRLLAGTLVHRLNEDLGHGTVSRVVVRGPAPPRRMGPLRVRGTRSDNGDYG